jgi:ABC-type branched-subunit amino acid transport system ATPase component
VTGALLDVRSLTVQIARRNLLDETTFAVRPQSILLVTGHNGAGKTTLLQAVLGLMPRTSGEVVLAGRDVTSLTTRELVQAGVVMTQQTQSVFPNLTVKENLRLPVSTERSFSDEAVHELFPVLAERGTQLAGTLSGGQRQMLSIALALRCGPQVLMLDEPSVGLQPTLVEAVMAKVAVLRDEHKMAVVLVEQNLRQALEIADDVMVLSQGRVVHASTRQATSEDEVWSLL